MATLLLFRTRNSTPWFIIWCRSYVRVARAEIIWGSQNIGEKMKNNGRLAENYTRIGSLFILAFTQWLSWHCCDPVMTPPLTTRGTFLRGVNHLLTDTPITTTSHSHRRRVTVTCSVTPPSQCGRTTRRTASISTFLFLIAYASHPNRTFSFFFLRFIFWIIYKYLPKPGFIKWNIE